MYVMADSQWSTSGAVGNLILANGTYTGTVKYDSGYTANVTVNEGATWVLNANTSICKLVNNGTIITNGYTLTTTSSSGSGSQQITGVEQVQSDNLKSNKIYRDGQVLILKSDKTYDALGIEICK